MDCALLILDSILLVFLFIRLLFIKVSLTELTFLTLTQSFSFYSIFQQLFSSQCIYFNSSPSFLQVFNNLIELVTSCGNYSQYRKRFSECLGFRFPILGVHLKDLIAVHVALPDWADKEKTRVNLAKTQQLYAILQELALIQNTPPSIDANTDLLNLLTVSTDPKLCVYVCVCANMIEHKWNQVTNKFDVYLKVQQ